MAPAPAQQRSRRYAVAAATLLATSGLAACGITIPADPDGTLDHIHGAEIRAGYVAEPGLIEAGNPNPVGPLADLITDYAETEGASVDWTMASEETLTNALDRGTIDIAVGGFTDKTPWTDLASVSRAFTTAEHPTAPPRHVALVPLGENAFLTSFETFLDEEGLT